MVLASATRVHGEGERREATEVCWGPRAKGMRNLKGRNELLKGGKKKCIFK